MAKTPADFTVTTKLYFSGKAVNQNVKKTADLKCTQEAFEIVKREILGWEEDETEFGSMQKHKERDDEKIDALDADVEKFIKDESKETLKSLKDRFDSLFLHYTTHHAGFKHEMGVDTDVANYKNLFDINGQKLTTLKAKMSALKPKPTAEEIKKAAEKKKAEDKKKADLKALEAAKNKWTNGQIALIVALIVVALAAIIAIAVCIIIMKKNKASEDDDESM